MKKRTPLKERSFPNYTRGEEIANMVTHIVGGAVAIAITVLCIIMAASHGNVWGVVSSSIYGGTMIVMFTVSSVYHGLHKNTGKQVMRIIDHCDIYFLIAGTYTPILLTAIRSDHPGLAWTIFGIEWGCALAAAAINAIVGWAIIVCAKITISAMTFMGFLWILLGGVAFTIGAVLYLIGAKKHYIHSIFHVFVIAGCVLQFFGILFYVL